MWGIQRSPRGPPHWPRHGAHWLLGGLPALSLAPMGPSPAPLQRALGSPGGGEAGEVPSLGPAVAQREVWLPGKEMLRLTRHKARHVGLGGGIREPRQSCRLRISPMYTRLPVIIFIQSLQ